MTNALIKTYVTHNGIHHHLWSRISCCIQYVCTNPTFLKIYDDKQTFLVI